MEFECSRCGLVSGVTEPIDGRLTRHRATVCPSCKAKRAIFVQTAYGLCKPWHGQFDEWDNPVDAKTGELHMPGIRFCGKRDCVEVEHVSVVASERRVIKIEYGDPVSDYDLTMALDEVRKRRKK